MAEAKVFKNFINGKWVESKSGKTYENINPANTDEVVGVFQKSNADDVKDALDAAAEAYKSWRLVPAPKRGEILYRVAARLEKEKENLSKDMTREMGKILDETRGDVQEAIDMTYYMAGEGRRMFGQTTPSEMKNKFNMTIRQPLGVCTFITPWNFPMAIPSWKSTPALVCGNTVVIKPATDTPLSVINFARILEEEGIPPGVFNVVTGSGGALGEPLIQDDRVKVVSFTGSTEVGRKISEMCAPGFKHTCLEMGGKNVQIVMDDAKLELAVEGALWGAFGTTGQRCTATSRIVCHKEVVKKFTAMMVERANALRVGDGLDPKTQMGPHINEGQLSTVLEYVDIGKNEGAKMECGGERLTGGSYDKGWFVKPTIFSEVNQKMRIWREEIFGPVLSIAVCDNIDHAIEMAFRSEHPALPSIQLRDAQLDGFRGLDGLGVLPRVDAAHLHLQQEAIRRFERTHIAMVLRLTGGNREKAAEELGVSEATLYRRIEKLGLKGYP